MTGSRRAHPIAVAAAVALLLATPEPAQAVPPPPAAATCATGAITDHRVHRDESGRPALALSGWLRPCDAGSAGSGYLVLRYDLGRTAAAHRGAYLPPPAATPVEVRIGLVPHPWAVCLVDGSEGRVACLGFDFSGPAPVPVPLSPDDPLLDGPPPVVLDPTCGTCV